MAHEPPTPEMPEIEEEELLARWTELLASIDAAQAEIEETGGIPVEEVFAEIEEIVRRAEAQAAGR
jgi:hypothetical protein